MIAISQNEDQYDQIKSSGKLVSVRVFLLIVISLVMNIIDASAGTVTLGWDHLDKSIAGYSIYYGSKDKSYQISVPIKELSNQKEPSYTVPGIESGEAYYFACLLYTSPSPRDGLLSRMPSSA